MVQYDYLEENEGSELLKRINGMAREGWRVVGFAVCNIVAGLGTGRDVLTGTARLAFCALVEREVPEGKEG